jgi:DUF4097 and DUF4098 domain-containing protein YvlB
VNVAGEIVVSGWDRPEVSVTGEVGDRVERVELSHSDHHTVVRVVLPQGIGTHFGGDGSAHLTIQVPNRSSLQVSLVSTDLKVTGVSGSQQLRTVSGDITSEGGGAATITSASGDVHLTVTDGAAAHVETMSGDVSVKGAGGDVSVSTVSGGGHLGLQALHSFNLRTVSGDFEISARLDGPAQFAVEAVSGDVKVDLSGAPAAEFDLHSLSGDISTCGPEKPVRPQYGPGSRLMFSTGNGGGANVRMSSTSGDLSVCAH